MRDPAIRSGVIRSRAILALGLAGWPALAAAQSTALGAAIQTPAPSRTPSVVVPHAGIDPGMQVKPPRMPPSALQVIKPRITPAPGSDTVVMPK